VHNVLASPSFPSLFVRDFTFLSTSSSSNYGAKVKLIIQSSDELIPSVDRLEADISHFSGCPKQLVNPIAWRQTRLQLNWSQEIIFAPLSWQTKPIYMLF
jgi:hypothetical protein